MCIKVMVERYGIDKILSLRLIHWEIVLVARRRKLCSTCQDFVSYEKYFVLWSAHHWSRVFFVWLTWSHLQPVVVHPPQNEAIWQYHSRDVCEENLHWSGVWFVCAALLSIGRMPGEWHPRHFKGSAENTQRVYGIHGFYEPEFSWPARTSPSGGKRGTAGRNFTLSATKLQVHFATFSPRPPSNLRQVWVPEEG